VSNPTVKVAFNAAKINNTNSQSNGSIMKCTPMAVFTSGITKESDIINVINADTRMVHPCKLVQEAIVVY
jgi:ADP-ribosylglycohydrolase